MAEGSRPHGGHASRLEGELGGRGGSEAAGEHSGMKELHTVPKSQVVELD